MTCGGGSSIDFSSALNEWRGKLMNFVDDENLVAVPHGHDRQPVDDHLAHVVDAGMRRGVDLHDVDVAPFGNLAAGVAHPAGIGRRPLVAAQRARQNPRRRRLADAARTRKHERLRNPPALDGVGQRTRHSRLADDVIELLRAPLAGENLVGHTRDSGFRVSVPVPGSGFRVPGSGSRFGVRARTLNRTWNLELERGTGTVEPWNLGFLRGPEGLRHSSGTT